MKKILRKYLMSSFYVITLIFSFLLLTLHFVVDSVGNYSVSFTQLAPAFSVFFIVFVIKENSIIYEINRLLYLKLTSVKWLILAILIPAFCIVASGLILSLFKMTYIFWNGDTLFYALNIVAIFVGCFAEEIGWRGFLLPRLQKKYSPLKSSIIVGILWGIWHLNFTGGVPGFIFYTITIIEMSILMTWLYNKTGGSLFLMIIWHFIFNLSSHLFLWERFTIYLFIVESIVFGITCLVLILTNRKEFLWYQGKNI